ncbi:hypothetical protein [Pleionea litopenaei]|uniref:Uncharacterized protein n=1 Tax=Pleionea litopenaei TaxID=3070815 RepID=A0AA51RWP2_9GAMM|nr:hypothetical protein [Pleionea sp. HL-JVS1]WMS88982.1 hypothetical protein Q9312_08715 [Pleionea sp. HL-JVS1]
MFVHRHLAYPVEEGSMEDFLAAIAQQKSKAPKNEPSQYNYLEQRFAEEQTQLKTNR